LTSLRGDLRYSLRLLARNPGFTSVAVLALALVDGGLPQLHAAAEALESAGIPTQPLAAIAKREEWIYVLGQEDEPVKLDRFSPVLHLVQSVRDEAHRFAVTFHRARRDKAMLGGARPEALSANSSGHAAGPARVVLRRVRGDGSETLLF
jgi:hypothetical protein